jgi:hypothetical protein
MGNDFKPTDKYRSLTDERLSQIVEALRVVRNDALKLYEPLKGDGPWSLGTRIYERNCFTIENLTSRYSWLTVIEREPGLRFSFAIEGVPLRFFKGPAEHPPPNYLESTVGEVAQRLLFPDLRPFDKTLRIALETDAEGRLSSAKLVELDEVGNVTGIYEIPYSVSSSNVAPLETEAVHLPPVEVEPIAEEEQKKKKKKSA